MPIRPQACRSGGQTPIKHAKKDLPDLSDQQISPQALGLPHVSPLTADTAARRDLPAIEEVVDPQQAGSANLVPRDAPALLLRRCHGHCQASGPTRNSHHAAATLHLTHGCNDSLLGEWCFNPFSSSRTCWYCAVKPYIGLCHLGLKEPSVVAFWVCHFFSFCGIPETGTWVMGPCNTPFTFVTLQQGTKQGPRGGLALHVGRECPCL